MVVREAGVLDWIPAPLVLDTVSEVEDESLLLETLPLGGGEKLS